METDNSSAVSRKQIEGSFALTEDLSEGQGDQEEGSTTLLLVCVIFFARNLSEDQGDAQFKLYIYLM